MKNKRKKTAPLSAVLNVIRVHPLLFCGLILAVVGSVGFALIPPLQLERIIGVFTESGDSSSLPWLAALYLLVLALSGLSDSAKEALITIFGQKVTRTLRHLMCAKLSYLPASYFSENLPGNTASRFVGDIDTVEALFTSGVIGLFADAAKIIGILAVISVKSPGLGVLMIIITPLLFMMTRAFRKRILKAQLDNRSAVGNTNNRIPETIRNARMIHTLHREKYMEERYRTLIDRSYRAIDRTNFLDSVYSPIILTIASAVTATVMVLSATGGGARSFFGMSAATAVAVISYIGSIFSPLEGLGMEIQNIQSALAGLKRVDEFMSAPERKPANNSITFASLTANDRVCVELSDVSFSYDKKISVLSGISFTVGKGEFVTIAGRTGAGKSTIFKLLTGQYTPDGGKVLIFGTDADIIPDREKRRIFGYVEQSFRSVPGSVADQISLFDPSLSREDIKRAADFCGIGGTIDALPQGYDTEYNPALFSEGQRQLLSIARATVADPKILLLDEITANLDSETEHEVLTALRMVGKNRTVISISHRLADTGNTRIIHIDQ